MKLIATHAVTSGTSTLNAMTDASNITGLSTRAANAARQAEITQEIMEIVGGAEALAGSSE